MLSCHSLFFFFFFNDTATTEIYTLSLHDALPISPAAIRVCHAERATAASRYSPARRRSIHARSALSARAENTRSEEHTSELQSLAYLVCRLLLEKKKNKTNDDTASLHVPASKLLT